MDEHAEAEVNPSRLRTLARRLWTAMLIVILVLGPASLCISTGAQFPNVGLDSSTHQAKVVGPSLRLVGGLSFDLMVSNWHGDIAEAMAENEGFHPNGWFELRNWPGRDDEAWLTLLGKHETFFADPPTMQVLGFVFDFHTTAMGDEADGYTARYFEVRAPAWFLLLLSAAAGLLLFRQLRQRPDNAPGFEVRRESD